MDLNEKIEQLVRITTALKKEVNELKDKNLITELIELEKEKGALKQDILDLRNSLVHQNQKILTLIKLQNDRLIETIEADKITPKITFARKISEFSKLFPIKSLKELDELEKAINDSNINELIAIARQLLQPKGIVKNISLVMSVPCIMECNVDGYHNKRRLLNSPKFIELIYSAAYDEGCSREIFLSELRRGFKMVKNRYNKNLCRYRQIQRQRKEQMEAQLVEIGEIKLPQEFVEIEETEKIYLD